MGIDSSVATGASDGEVLNGSSSGDSEAEFEIRSSDSEIGCGEGEKAGSTWLLRFFHEDDKDDESDDDSESGLADECSELESFEIAVAPPEVDSDEDADDEADDDGEGDGDRVMTIGSAGGGKGDAFEVVVVVLPAAAAMAAALANDEKLGDAVAGEAEPTMANWIGGVSASTEVAGVGGGAVGTAGISIKSSSSSSSSSWSKGERVAERLDEAVRR